MISVSAYNTALVILDYVRNAGADTTLLPADTGQNLKYYHAGISKYHVILLLLSGRFVHIIIRGNNMTESALSELKEIKILRKLFSKCVFH